MTDMDKDFKCIPKLFIIFSRHQSRSLCVCRSWLVNSSATNLREPGNQDGQENYSGTDESSDTELDIQVQRTWSDTSESENDLMGTNKGTECVCSVYVTEDSDQDDQLDIHVQRTGSDTSESENDLMGTNEGI